MEGNKIDKNVHFLTLVSLFLFKLSNFSSLFLIAYLSGLTILDDTSSVFVSAKPTIEVDEK